MASRLSTHMNENNLAESMQSADRPGHSSETALLHVHNNMLRAVDEQKAVAFDTIDHNIMLSRLRGFVKLKKIQKSEKNSDWSDPTHPSPYPIF